MSTNGLSIRRNLKNFFKKVLLPPKYSVTRYRTNLFYFGFTISDLARLQFGVLINCRFISVSFINFIKMTKIVYKATLIISDFLSGGCPIYFPIKLGKNLGCGLAYHALAQSLENDIDGIPRPRTRLATVSTLRAF
jgi:hypothetical protein